MRLIEKVRVFILISKYIYILSKITKLHMLINIMHDYK
jgi:hypothetical protein